MPQSELLEQLTLNINVRLIAGKRFTTGTNGEEAGEGRRLRKAIKEALYLSAVFVRSDWIPWLECLDVHGHVSSMKRTFKEIDLLLGKWLKEHRQARDNHDHE